MVCISLCSKVTACLEAGSVAPASGRKLIDAALKHILHQNKQQNLKMNNICVCSNK